MTLYGWLPPNQRCHLLCLSAMHSQTHNARQQLLSVETYPAANGCLACHPSLFMCHSC